MLVLADIEILKQCQLLEDELRTDESKAWEERDYHQLAANVNFQKDLAIFMSILRDLGLESAVMQARKEVVCLVMRRLVNVHK